MKNPNPAKSDLYTHRVAVIGYLIRDNHFLLLKREKPPRIWVPPGGHLKPNEDPKTGLIREIKEETNFLAEILAPVDTWFGKWDNAPLLSIDFVVRVVAGELWLSSEHSAFLWLTLEEIEKQSARILDPRAGFRIEDFKRAQQLYNLFSPD